jgi:hypothetical protein
MLLILPYFSSSCGHKDAAADSKLVGIFSDFTFVGSAPYSQTAEAQTTVPPHGLMELAPPSQLPAGRQFIFHHRRPLDDEQLALTLLPQRLRASGLEVTAGPHSSRDLIYLVYGGPLFRIEFHDNNRKAFIFNRLCPQLMQAEKDAGQWIGEDYVLAIPIQH